MYTYIGITFDIGVTDRPSREVYLYISITLFATGTREMYLYIRRSLEIGFHYGETSLDESLEKILEGIRSRDIVDVIVNIFTCLDD